MYCRIWGLDPGRLGLLRTGLAQVFADLREAMLAPKRLMVYSGGEYPGGTQAVPDAELKRTVTPAVWKGFPHVWEFRVK